ncbi:hypothetical protein [Luteimonas abyssi]|uniref:hypothetical protein n=1 Tax=Luteimonas abyssi TaxID=1247514 RepID=UPI000AD97AF8|nr:hypothetical protein [Luteimonas abyssi]
MKRIDEIKDRYLSKYQELLDKQKEVGQQLNESRKKLQDAENKYDANGIKNHTSEINSLEQIYERIEKDIEQYCINVFENGLLDELSQVIKEYGKEVREKDQIQGIFDEFNQIEKRKIELNIEIFKKQNSLYTEVYRSTEPLFKLAKKPSHERKLRNLSTDFNMSLKLYELDHEKEGEKVGQ